MNRGRKIKQIKNIFLITEDALQKQDPNISQRGITNRSPYINHGNQFPYSW